MPLVVTKLDDQHMALTIWGTNDLVIGTYYLTLNVHFTKQTKASEETRFGNITNDSAIVRSFKQQWPTLFWKTRRIKPKICIYYWIIKSISNWHRIKFHNKCSVNIQSCFTSRSGARKWKSAASPKWLKSILAPRNGISTIAIRGQL